MFTLFKKLKASPRRRRSTRRHLPRVYGLRQAERGQIRRHRSSHTQATPHAGLSRREQPRQHAAHTCHRLAADAKNSRERQCEEHRGGQRQPPISTPQRRRDGGHHKRRGENPQTDRPRRREKRQPPPSTRRPRKAYRRSRRSRGEKQNHQPHDPHQNPRPSPHTASTCAETEEREETPAEEPPLPKHRLHPVPRHNALQRAEEAVGDRHNFAVGIPNRPPT